MAYFLLLILFPKNNQQNTPPNLFCPYTRNHYNSRKTVVQLKIEHLLFELNCCVNDLQSVRLQIPTDEIHQTELSLNKLESLISFVKAFSDRKIAY